MLILQDGSEVTHAQIARAFYEGKARLVHGRGEGCTKTGLMLDGIDRDTRGECYSMWEEVWTSKPESLSAALRAARFY